MSYLQEHTHTHKDLEFLFAQHVSKYQSAVICGFGDFLKQPIDLEWFEKKKESKEDEKKTSPEST